MLEALGAKSLHPSSPSMRVLYEPYEIRLQGVLTIAQKMKSEAQPGVPGDYAAVDLRCMMLIAIYEVSGMIIKANSQRPLTLLRLKIAQEPYIIWSLGPKSLKYMSPQSLRVIAHGSYLQPGGPYKCASRSPPKNSAIARLCTPSRAPAKVLQNGAAAELMLGFHDQTISIYIYTDAYIHHIHILCTYICIYICVCVYIHTHTHTHYFGAY